MQSNLLTPEANDALNWLIDRMPDRTFELFSAEIDASLREIAMRFGLDDKLVHKFKIDRLISRRKLLVAADDSLQVFHAHIYSGEKTYAVIGTGNIFHQCTRGNWRPSKLNLQEVIARSITRTTAPVKIKSRYL